MQETVLSEADGAVVSPLIGRIIDGRYQIRELLGEGGMGAVYVAEHLRLRKQVAIKTIRAEFAEHSQAEARFAREALATAQLDHPHVASAIDFGHLPDGGAYLVIQLVRGESLGARLERGPLPWRELCVLAAQVADALSAAHAAGIIHRDLKPDNILIERRTDGSPHAKVLDFGIARVVEGALEGDAAQQLTRMGAVLGTPGYMAPEQAVGGDIDHRVDLYALGVILWEGCTGQPLWEAETLTEIFTAQLTRTPPDLTEGLPDLPPEFSRLVMQLLAKSRDHRPTDAATVREQLRQIASNAALAAHIAQTPAPAASTAAAIVPSVPVNAHPWAARAWMSLALLCGLAFVIALIVRRGPEATADTNTDPQPPTAPAQTPDAAPESVVDAINTITTPPEVGLPSRQALLQDIPEEFKEPAQVLLLDTDRRERQKAGRLMAKAKGPEAAAIPEYMRTIAEIENTSDCDNKRKHLLKLEEAEEIRSLWSLRIISETPRRGCGRPPFGTPDCLACLREDLARIIARFEAQAEP